MRPCPWVEHQSGARVVRSEVRGVGSVCLLGAAFEKEVKVLSTSASEAFFH